MTGMEGVYVIDSISLSVSLINGLQPASISYCVSLCIPRVVGYEVYYEVYVVLRLAMCCIEVWCRPVV